MMNLLSDPLPENVRIGGRLYPIRWDSRTALRILCAFEDDSLADFEKQAVMLSLFYPRIPPDTERAAVLAVRFLNCGKELPSDPQPRLYSFSHDAPLIYAAMHRSHHIDVSVPMHWYSFAALFLDIGADTLFAQIVWLRRQKLLGKLTKEERQMLASLGETAALPQPRTPEERAAEQHFRALLCAGQHSKEVPDGI